MSNAPFPKTLFWLFALWLLIAVCAAPALEAKDESARNGLPDQEQYELFKLLVDTIDQVERNYVKEVDRRALIEAAIEGVLGKLDPYSAYIGPEELKQFRSSVESEFGGIGIQIGMEEGRLKVISPLVGTPAYRAGIVAGDWIVEIDGGSTKGIAVDEAVKRLKGEPGTKVTLSVIREQSAEKQTFEIARERILVETILGDRRDENDAWVFFLEGQSGVAYVRLAAFGRDTARELQRVLKRLKAENAQGLILDLRFNPGGLLSAAIEVADLFISEGRIVSTEGRNVPERAWDAGKRSAFENVPMVVLVNRYSASASEIVAACLQDNKRALIVGERTWGKGSVQNVVELEDGASALKLTTASYHRPSGKNIHRFDNAAEDDEWGVTPDVGYELKLDTAELASLMQERRQRDIVRPNAGTADNANPEAPPIHNAATSRATTDRQLELALKHLSGELAQAQ